MQKSKHMSASEQRNDESANNLSKPFTSIEVVEVPAFKRSYRYDDRRSRSVKNVGIQNGKKRSGKGPRDVDVLSGLRTTLV